MECKVNKPYPKIKVEKPNTMYAYLLLEDYTGIVSEQSAISQYIYQDFTKFNLNKEFSETLGKIARVEMIHLELLGKTIKLLGVDPKFLFKDNNNNLNYWTSYYVNYNTNLIDMLKSDIQIEQIAINNYRYHINIIGDKYIKKLLSRIIEDEQKHIECFQYLLNKALNNCYYK